MKYEIIMSDSAQADYDEYIDYIVIDCDAPTTAAKHYADIKDIISSLSVNPLIYAVRYNDSLLRYGLNVRRVNYKKMAILFTVNEDKVFIHRVIAGSMITGISLN